MLTLTFSRYSLLGDAEHPYIKYCINSANALIKETFPVAMFNDIANTAELTLSLTLERENGDEPAGPAPVLLDDPDLKAAVLLKYTHPDKKNKNEYTWCRREGSLLDLGFLTSAVLHHAHSQLTCRHEWGRPLSKAGIPFPDGRRICVHCRLAHADGLPKLNNMPVFSTSYGGDEICRHPWPAETKLQGSESGLVLCDNGQYYNTAFFEAFPHYGSLSTFLRGEGATLHEAEAKAWEKHQKILSCREHQWTRNVNGDYREDGYAQCELCGLKAEALTPLTLCKTCERPTKLEMNNGVFLCPTHYYAQTEEVLIEDRLSAYRQYRGDDYANDSRNQITFRIRIEMFFHRLFLQSLSLDEYESHYTYIRHWANHLTSLIKHAAHKLTLNQIDQVPTDLNNPITKSCLNHTERHVEQFIAALKAGETKIKNTLFIPSKFLK